MAQHYLTLQVLVPLKTLFEASGPGKFPKIGNKHCQGYWTERIYICVYIYISEEAARGEQKLQLRKPS